MSSMDPWIGDRLAKLEASERFQRAERERMRFALEPPDSRRPRARRPRRALGHSLIRLGAWVAGDPVVIRTRYPKRLSPSL